MPPALKKAKRSIKKTCTPKRASFEATRRLDLLLNFRRLAIAELVFLHTDEFNYGLDNPIAGLMSANMSLRQRFFVAASSS